MSKLSIDEIKRLIEFQKEDFPDLYRAIKNDSLILFVGAGVSKLYGPLLWTEMAMELVKIIRANKIISYAEEDILVKDSIIDPRKVISICYELCKDNKSLLIYTGAIEGFTEIKSCVISKKIYEKIFSIGALTYLTTNIDLGIREYAIKEKYIQNLKTYDCTSPADIEKIKQVNYNIFKDGNIIYLHGTRQNILEAILTVEKYLSFYSNKSGFLNDLFLNMQRMKPIILFIGYSLSEWDVIERIYKIRQSIPEFTGYLLSPIYSHEITKFSLERNYYRSFGVEAIPYIIDNSGYEMILFILENLSRATDLHRPSPYEMLSKIEEVK